MTASCGASTPTSSPPGAKGVTAIQKVSGDGQRGPVTLPLAAPLVAHAYLDTTHGASRVRLSLMPTGRASDTVANFSLGPPLKNTLVSFVVSDAKCGHPFSNAEFTDSLGMVRQLWIAGVKAGTGCTMGAQAVDQATGAPVTYATFTADFRPAAVADANVFNRDTLVRVGDTLHLAGLVYSAFDAYGNAVPVGSYRLGYRRQNITGALSDAATIVASTAVVRTGDFALQVMLDSIGKTILLRPRTP
jgi:hypothetical protein